MGKFNWVECSQPSWKLCNPVQPSQFNIEFGGKSTGTSWTHLNRSIGFNGIWTGASYYVQTFVRIITGYSMYYSVDKRPHFIWRCVKYKLSEDSFHFSLFLVYICYCVLSQDQYQSFHWFHLFDIKKTFLIIFRGKIYFIAVNIRDSNIIISKKNLQL